MVTSEVRKETSLIGLVDGLKGLDEGNFRLLTQLVGEESNKRNVGEMRQTVHRKVDDTSDAIIVVPLGDLHAGSGATKWEEVMDVVQTIISTPGVYVVGVGDWIESVDPKHGVNSVQESLSLFDQVSLVRDTVVAPLANAGRLLGIVKGHRAHEGALAKSVGDDPWRRMVEGFDVPMIPNGGIMEIVFDGPNGEEKHVVYQCNHNTRGRSGKSPIRAQEIIAKRFSPTNVPDVIVGAHTHRSGLEVGMNSAMINIGTPKGNRDNPDPYGISMGFDGTDPAGQGLLMWPDGGKRGRDYEVLPYADWRTGLMNLGAMRLWEKMEKHGITKEVVEEVRHRDGAIKVIYDSAASAVSVQDEVGRFGKRNGNRDESAEASEADKNMDGSESMDFDILDIAPQEKLVWNVHTQLPVGLFALSNMRFGSRTRDMDQEIWVREKLADGAMLWLAGRQVVDRKIPSSPMREEAVDQALEIMNIGKERLLGILFDAVLKREAWIKPIKEGRDVLDPLFAASQIAACLGTQLVEHMGVVQVNLGPAKQQVSYRTVVMDNLENRGSTGFATGGLISVYQDRLDTKPGIMVGGHMPGAGVAQFYDAMNPETQWPVVVAPGWMSKRSNWRQSSVTESPADGLGPGVILMPGGLGIFPNDYAVVPVGRKEQWELLNALTVLAAGRLGWVDVNKF